MLTDVLTGMNGLLRGYRLLARKGLRRYVAIPFIINIFVFLVLVWSAIEYFDSWVQSLLPASEQWWAVLVRGLLWIVFVLFGLLAVFFTFTLIANLIGAPFNGLLAAKVERLVTGSDVAASSSGFLVGILPAIFGEIRKFGYFLAWAIPLLVLFLIPVVNLFAPVVWFIFMSWMLALEYLAYPMENGGLRFAQTRKLLHRRRGLSLGFGGAVAVALLLPGINLLVMPAAVAGATLLWVERLRTTSHLRE